MESRSETPCKYTSHGFVTGQTKKHTGNCFVGEKVTPDNNLF